MIQSTSRIQRMITIYSQRDTIHANNFPQDFFSDNNTTEWQAGTHEHN